MKRVSAANPAVQIAVARFILRSFGWLVYLRMLSTLSVRSRLGTKLGRWLRIGPGFAMALALAWQLENRGYQLRRPLI